MQSLVTKAALATILAAAVVAPAPTDAAMDHLKCYKIRDSFAHRSFDVQLTDEFGAEGCKMNQGRFFCTAADKRSVVPSPPGGGPSGTAAGNFLCYESHCRNMPPDTQVTDQFGRRIVHFGRTKLVCTPVTPNPPPPTTSTTAPQPTTTTTSSTTITSTTSTSSSTSSTMSSTTSTSSSTSSTINASTSSTTSSSTSTLVTTTSSVSTSISPTFTTTTQPSLCGNGVVDAGESCDEGPSTGLTGSCCAVNCVFKPAGAACADDGNPCTTDTCSGSSIVCQHQPGNGGTICRPAAGPCDVPETCSGDNASCPADGLVSSTVTCRAAAGQCDPAETCSGTDAACPADSKSVAVCRPAASQCDVAETCNGISNDCPIDVAQPNGTPCDDGNACTTGDNCQFGGCSGVFSCDDTNPCTIDSCDVVTGCLHEPDPSCFTTTTIP